MADAIKNFAYGTVLTAPSPATSGTSLVLNSGQGANFAVGNAVCWPANVNPTSANAEIVRVTAVSTDTLTITRAQESTTAQSIAVGWQIQQGVTAALLAQYMADSTYDPAAISQQVVGTTATQTLTNKRITKRTLSLSANSATPAINTDNYDVVHITSQTAAITGFTMTGTPVDGDTLRISITATAATTVAWGTSFEASAVALPTIIGTTRLDVHFDWNTETSKWRMAWATGGAIAAGSVGSASAIPVLTYNAEGQITAVSTAAPAAGALSYDGQVLGSTVNLTTSGLTTVYTTASLAVGYWLITVTQAFQNGATASAASWVMLNGGTATYSVVAGATNGEVIFHYTNDYGSCSFTCIVHITAAGTIIIAGQSGGGAGYASVSGGNPTGSSGYTAIKIA